MCYAQWHKTRTLKVVCCTFPTQALGIVCYVGISFGPVFTASIGGTRREFMLVGDVVNTAGEASV